MLNALKISIVAILFTITSGCTLGEKVGRIAPGMSKQQVVAILGKPDGFQQRGDYRIYKYTNRLISGWAWDRADYSFIFENDQLIEYGAGEVRERNIGGVHTIFIPQY